MLGWQDSFWTWRQRKALTDGAIAEAQTCRPGRRHPGEFARLRGERAGRARLGDAKGVKDRLVLGHRFAGMPV